MPPAKMRSHLYLRAVKWAAKELPPSHGGQDAPALAECHTVRLMAFLWDRPALLVAREILALRGDRP